MEVVERESQIDHRHLIQMPRIIIEEIHGDDVNGLEEIKRERRSTVMSNQRDTMNITKNSFHLKSFAENPTFVYF